MAGGANALPRWASTAELPSGLAKYSLVCPQFKVKTITPWHVLGRAMTALAKRLKEARLRAGLSQERLGVLAGIDEMTASARMNQYERGKHAPDWLTVQRLAAVLQVPVAYLYAEDDAAAELLLAFYALPLEAREKAVNAIRKIRD